MSATSVAATARPATTESAAAAAFFARARDIYRQIPAIHSCAVQRGHRLLRLLLRAHRDEAKSSRAAGFAVCHQVGFKHGAVRSEGILKIIFSRVKRKVSNEQFVIH